jgi:hypothetical protein
MQNVERRVWREARAMTRREVITKAITIFCTLGSSPKKVKMVAVGTVPAQASRRQSYFPANSFLNAGNTSLPISSILRIVRSCGNPPYWPSKSIWPTPSRVIISLSR